MRFSPGRERGSSMEMAHTAMRATVHPVTATQEPPLTSAPSRLEFPITACLLELNGTCVAAVSSMAAGRSSSEDRLTRRMAETEPVQTH